MFGKYARAAGCFGIIALQSCAVASSHEVEEDRDSLEDGPFVDASDDAEPGSDDDTVGTPIDTGAGDGESEPRPGPMDGDGDASGDADPVDGGGPPAGSDTCTGGGAAEADGDTVVLAAQAKRSDDAPGDQEVKPQLAIVNRGASTVSLTDLTLTYWFTRDGSGVPLVSECDYAVLGCGNVNLATGEACGDGVDSYLQVTFAGGELPPGATTGELQLRVHKADWSAFDETDDLSYCAGLDAFGDAPHVSIGFQGRTVWGERP